MDIQCINQLTDIKWTKKQKQEKVSFNCQLCGSKGSLSLGHLIKRNNLYCYKCNMNASRINKYGSIENYIKITKENRLKTNIRKYGGEKEALQIRNHHSIETNLKKYGVKNSYQIDQKLKIQKKYGVDNVFQLNETKSKSKSTNLKKRGVQYYSQSKEWLIKTKQSNLKKFGVEFPSQSFEIQSKSSLNMKRSVAKDGTILDSKWEAKVWDYCISNKLKIKRGPSIKLPSGKFFHVDFDIEGDLYEIKSSYIMSMQKNIKEKLDYCKSNNITVISDNEIKKLGEVLPRPNITC